MKTFTTLVVSAALLSMSSVGMAAEKKTSAEQVRYESALSAAKEARSKAAAVGGEWRDIGKTLKKAAQLAGSGDFSAATKLAEKAEFQAKMGHAQALSQKGLGTPSYMR